jgi:MFS family permease
MKTDRPICWSALERAPHGRVVQQVVRQLGNREDVHQIEEQLDVRNPLLTGTVPQQAVGCHSPTLSRPGRTHRACARPPVPCSVMKAPRRLWQYLAGAAAARAGDEMSGPALLLLGFAVSRRPATGSELLASLTIAAALGGPAFGAVLDRSRRPDRVLAATLGAYALGLVAIDAAVGHLPISLVVVVALAAGLFNPAVAGGWTAQLPRVVPGPGLARASALDSMSYNAASLAGPALAALIVAAGFAVIVTRRRLLRATVTSVLSYVGIGMLLVCFPVLGAQRLGGAPRGALLISAMAAASLIANALRARWPPRGEPDTGVLVSTLVIGASVAAAAIAPGWLTVLAIAAGGAGDGPQLTSLFAVRHRDTPEHMRGQVYTTGASLKIAGFAAGAALAGPLAGRSVTACLLVAAGLQLCAAAAYLLTGSGGRAAAETSPARASTETDGDTTARSEVVLWGAG